MSDVTEPTKPVTVTFAEIVGFFEEKAPNLTCSVCKADKWTVLLADDEAKASTFDHPERDGSLTYRSYCLVCNNCGQMNFHMAAVIEEWLVKKKAAQ